MATVTPILDTRYAAKDGYPIKIRIIHGDQQRNITTGYRVSDKQWKGNEVVNHPDADIINGVISKKVTDAKLYFADCKIKGVQPRIDLIGTGKTTYSFLEYLNHRAEQYAAKGQIVMKRKVKRFAKELKECFDRDVHFEDLHASSLRDLEAYLIKERENCANTRHKKYKFLGEFYAHAIKEGKAPAPNPFDDYKITKEPVKKEKLTREEVTAIETIDLADGPVNDARNLFLFSYYTKGSRFATCLTLSRNQIRDGRVYIQMNKGKKHISVKIHERLQFIIDQYDGDPLVFPFIDEVPADPEQYLKTVDSQNVIVNRNLKVVAALCDIKKNLTFHVARHTLAQRMKESSSSIHAIKEALGHSETRTTEIYLASLGDERLDEEMSKVYGS